jgi:hypothetical protein
MNTELNELQVEYDELLLKPAKTDDDHHRIDTIETRLAARYGILVSNGEPLEG